MARLAMVIDTRKCVGCMDCVVACKTENGVPEGGQPRPSFRRGRAREQGRVHRLQGLRGLVPLRRPIHPSRGIRGQVHVLHPPGGAGAPAGLRGRVPDALHVLRGPGRPAVGSEPAARRAQAPFVAARGGDQAADLLPGVTPLSFEMVTSRHNPLVDPSLHVWAWEIPVYLFLGGFVAGLMVLSVWARSRWACSPCSWTSATRPTCGGCT